MKQLEAYFPKDQLAAQGVLFDEAAHSLHQAVEHFVIQLAYVPEDELFVPIGKGRWSPAEYADHVYRAMLLYHKLVERAGRGQTPRSFERGWLTADGRMITAAEAEPVARRDRVALIRDLWTATAALTTAAARSAELGRHNEVCHINPYFGALTILECVQLAAVHARHHADRHLARK
jgi:hypothetical protein